MACRDGSLAMVLIHFSQAKRRRRRPMTRCPVGRLNQKCTAAAHRIAEGIPGVHAATSVRYGECLSDGRRPILYPPASSVQTLARSVDTHRAPVPMNADEQSCLTHIHPASSCRRPHRYERGDSCCMPLVGLSRQIIQIKFTKAPFKRLETRRSKAGNSLKNACRASKAPIYQARDYRQRKHRPFRFVSCESQTLDLVCHPAFEPVGKSQRAPGVVNAWRLPPGPQTAPAIVVANSERPGNSLCRSDISIP